MHDAAHASPGYACLTEHNHCIDEFGCLVAKALVHNPSAEADEDIARRMVGELHTILASAKFAAAAQVGCCCH